MARLVSPHGCTALSVKSFSMLAKDTARLWSVKVPGSQRQFHHTKSLVNSRGQLQWAEATLQWVHHTQGTTRKLRGLNGGEIVPRVSMKMWKHDSANNP